jgi:preprotein translocase subunit SecA
VHEDVGGYGVADALHAPSTAMPLEGPSAGRGGEGGVATEEAPVRVRQIVNEAPKVGRNDQCPCGSGKKYKKCCGVGVV